MFVRNVLEYAIIFCKNFGYKNGHDIWLTVNRIMRTCFFKEL